MHKETEGAAAIKETDIVFDCPHCNKSLAIDYRAAGLTIACTDCKKIIQVPIPQGMDLSDLDSSEEDLRVRATHLRSALTDSQTRIRMLEGIVDELRIERSEEEKAVLKLNARMDRAKREMEVMNRAVDQIMDAIMSMSRALKDEE